MVVAAISVDTVHSCEIRGKKASRNGRARVSAERFLAALKEIRDRNVRRANVGGSARSECAFRQLFLMSSSAKKMECASRTDGALTRAGMDFSVREE